MGFWGDLPTWLTTAAVLFAALQFLSERRGRQAEREREAKHQASLLNVWTVSDQQVEPKVYGVVIENASGSMFHDLEITAVLHGESTKPLTLQVLPPGRYFVQHLPLEVFGWNFAQEEREHGRTLRPHLKSGDYRVHQVSFNDNLGQRWETNDRAVLTRTESK